MSPGHHHGETIDWYVEPDRLDAPLPPALAVRRRRPDDERAQSLALAITTALLFVLITGAVMFGGRAAIEPLLRQNTARQRDGSADVLYAMPDGAFCRRMAFDNATGEITTADVEPCPAGIAGADVPSDRKFEWGR